MTTSGSTGEGTSDGTAEATTGAAPTTGGSSTGDGTSGGPTSEGSSEAETGAACELPPSLPYGPGVLVEVTNAGADPVFFNATNFCEAFTGFLVFPEGSDAPLDIDADCQFTCAEVFGGVSCSCDAGCPGESVYRLDPGKTLVLRWDGSQLEPRQLGEACEFPDCGSSCYVLAPVPEGAYKLVLPASSSIVCDSDCTCPPDDAEPCTVFGAMGQPDRTLELAFAYPAQTELALVFE